MTEFGRELILNGDVKYVGEGEDPAENPYMKAYARALKEVYQPERLNPEGKHEYGAEATLAWQDWMFPCDSLNSENK